jgi:glutaredoxin
MTVYSTGCPRCKVLEAKLKQKGINFIVENDIDEIMKKGFRTAPVLEYNGEYYTFENALRKSL